MQTRCRRVERGRSLIPVSVLNQFVIKSILCLIFGALALQGCAAYLGGNTVTSVPTRADLVIRNAVIYDPGQGIVGSSVAVRGGVIVAVGDAGAVRAFIQNKTQIFDAGGGLVLPGLQDAHGHLLNLAAERDRVDLRGCTSEAEMVARTVKFAETHPKGWLQGRAWDQNLWPGAAFPTRALLDREFPDRPVFLVRVDGHAGVANSRALAIARITDATGDPPGGRIMKDADGRPTGLLVDHAMDLVTRMIPPPTIGERESAILEAQKLLLEAGVTCVHEAGIGAADQSLLESLDARGRLQLRIYGMASSEAIPIAPSQGDRFTLRAVKAYADGALGSRGAALLEPYADDQGHSGLLLATEERLRELASICMDRGLQLCTHAIGDRGNKTVLDAIEAAALKKFGNNARPDLRFRMEHCQIVAPADFDRFHQLKMIASMQPTHATSDGPWAPVRVGSKRMEGAYAWSAFLERKVPLAFGSDFPVESYDPRFGLYAATTRRDPQAPEGREYGPSRRLTMNEAIAAFTKGAAYAMFRERDLGEIRTGMVADFSVFDINFAAPPDPSMILRSRTLLTIIGGRIAFQRGTAGGDN